MSDTRSENLNEQQYAEIREAYTEHTGNSAIDYDGREWHDFEGGYLQCLRRAPTAAPIVQPPVELSPRQLDDENEPAGYLECDREFFERNAELVRWYLEHDATIRAALQAPVVQAEPVAWLFPDGAVLLETDGDTQRGRVKRENGRALVLAGAAPTTAAADAKDAARLDYLQKHARCDPKMDGKHVWWPTAHKHVLRGPTLREAIDAAIAPSADEVKS